MGDKSTIEWTDATWNPIRGCSRVSEGCRNCYAERVAARFSGPGQPYGGLAVRKLGYGVSAPMTPRWTGEVRFVEEALKIALTWTKPRRIFVNSMSDLFHEKVEDEWLLKIFTVMAQPLKWGDYDRRHVYQILTKRPERMRAFMSRLRWKFGGPWRMPETADRPLNPVATLDPTGDPSPSPWIHLGVSVEDQATADARIPLLLQTPAAVRWVSYEPALGPVSFIDHDWTVKDYLRGTETCQHSVRPLPGKLDWLVIGGESGPGARPFDLAWARSAIAQCKAAGVPVFVKQLGSVPMLDRKTWTALHPTPLLRARNDARVPMGFEPLFFNDRKGGDPSEWPEDLRVREFPR